MPSTVDKNKEKQQEELAMALGFQVLAYLAQHPEYLGQFLSESGLGPNDLKEQIQDPAMIAALLDFVLKEHKIAEELAQALEIEPHELIAVRMALPGSDPENYLR